MLASAVALVVLLVPLGLLIESTDSAGVNWASGSSAGRLFTHIRASRSPCRCSTCWCSSPSSRSWRSSCWRAAGPPSARSSAGSGRCSSPLCWLVVPVAAVVMLSLVDRPLLVVRYLMVSLPAAVLLVALVIDRVASLARRGAVVVAAVLLVVVVGVVGRRRRAVVRQGRTAGLPVGGGLHCRPGPAGRRRADLRPVRAHTRRVVHGRQTGRRARACIPSTRRRRGAWIRWRFDGSVALDPDAIERAASKYQRIWLLSATADLSLYPAQARCGRRARSGGPGSRRPAPRTSAGWRSPKRCGSEPAAPGDQPGGGRPGGRGRGGPRALSGLVGLAHPGRPRQGRRRRAARGSGRSRARPDRRGAGLPGGGGDRGQDRGPAGQRVPGLARDPGGGRRGPRDGGGGRAGRRPGADRPGPPREVPGAQPGLRRGRRRPSS